MESITHMHSSYQSNAIIMMILASRIVFTFLEPFYHHCWLLSGPAPASDFETEKKNDFVQFACTNKAREDLIVLHSWTLFVVTFADAKVVKHVEPVKLETGSKYKEKKNIFIDIVLDGHVMSQQ